MFGISWTKHSLFQSTSCQCIGKAAWGGFNSSSLNMLMILRLPRNAKLAHRAWEKPAGKDTKNRCRMTHNLDAGGTKGWIEWLSGVKDRKNVASLDYLDFQYLFSKISMNHRFNWLWTRAVPATMCRCSGLSSQNSATLASGGGIFLNGVWMGLTNGCQWFIIVVMTCNDCKLVSHYEWLSLVTKPRG